MAEDTSSLPKPRIGLSARLLVLTIFFVMLAEFFIYTPSIANYRINYLSERIVRAYLATLALDAMEVNDTDPELERSLLKHTDTHGIVLQKGKQRLLITSGRMPPKVDATFDFRNNSFFGLIRDAFITLGQTENRVLRIVGAAPRTRGQVRVEIVIDEAPMRAAMVDFSQRILNLSIVISLFTASLVYLSLQLMMIRPMQKITVSMATFRAAPEDETKKFKASSSRGDEIGIAQRELVVMQDELRGALKQKNRLAMLGAAVAKVNHDLRNSLSTAVLISDKLARSEDPEVKRVVPRLLTAIDRSINLCGQTLEYVSDSRPKMNLRPTVVDELVRDAGDVLLAELGENADFQWNIDVPGGLDVEADHDQMMRVLGNLGRNAKQAGATAMNLTATVEDGTVFVELADDGPGMPQKAQDKLFQPFAGSARAGGTGLGLVIAREILQAHGGNITLKKTDPEGTTFRIEIPLTQSAEAA